MQGEKVADYITKWLKDYAESSHSKGFVIGVSGGIDSALVSTLCARTGAPVVVIEMPIRQSSSEIQRSRAHINWLTSKFPNVTGGEVNLTEVFETFEKTVKSNSLNEENSYTEVACANMRSRLRMVSVDACDGSERIVGVLFYRGTCTTSPRSKAISSPARETKWKTLALASLPSTVTVVWTSVPLPI